MDNKYLSNFTNSKWIDCKDYYLSVNGTFPKCNIEYSLSASEVVNVLDILDKSLNYYISPEKYAENVVFGIKPFFSETSKLYMKKGVKNEKIVLEMLEDFLNEEYKNQDIFLEKIQCICRPKFDLRLSCKADGLIYQGGKLVSIVEIKTCHSRKRIEKLSEIIENIKKGLISEEEINKNVLDSSFHHSFIDDSHYAQIQFTIKCHNVENCEYILSYPKENITLMWNIPYNDYYWKSFMEPKIREHFDINIKKALSKKEI